MATNDLVLFTNPASRGRIARWMLEEVGAPYDVEIVSYDGMKTPGYRAINPMGKVPTLVHGTTTITEGAAICAYLADAFPEAGLAPPPNERAAYYRWLFFAAGPLEAAVTNKALGFEVPLERERTAGYGNLDRVLSALEQAVRANDYIAGPAFSAADVYLGAQIGWSIQFGTFESRSAFAAYWERLAARPAYKRANDLDNAAMPADASA